MTFPAVCQKSRQVIYLIMHSEARTLSVFFFQPHLFGVSWRREKLQGRELRGKLRTCIYPSVTHTEDPASFSGSSALEDEDMWRMMIDGWLLRRQLSTSLSVYDGKLGYKKGGGKTQNPSIHSLPLFQLRVGVGT